MTNTDVVFTGTASGAQFVFTNDSKATDPSYNQGFQVTGSSNYDPSNPTLNTAVGLYGTIGGTYSYLTSSIVTDGAVQTATVSTTNGSLTITDQNNVSLSGTVSDVSISTLKTLGGVSGVISLTALSYSGSNADLLQLRDEAAANGGVLNISFQFAGDTSLTDLTGVYNAANQLNVNSASYSGSIATSAGFTTQSIVPEPSSLAIVGIGGLGFILYGIRRRMGL